jgi:hypothetical protein
MRKGYTAFLDVMGFSAMIAGERYAEGITDYLNALKSNLYVDDTNIEYVVFSDSIVITTANETDDSLQKIARACSSVFGALLTREIPVRGAIAHGSYVREKTNSGTFVAGRAIIDAYNFEKIQDWVGVMLCPSVRQKVKDLEDRCKLIDPVGKSQEGLEKIVAKAPWSAFIQPCDKIPFHTEPTDYSGFAIVPTDGQIDPTRVRNSLKASVGCLERLKTIAPDPKAQRKYDNTLKWIKPIREKWHQLAHYTASAA